MKDLYATYQQYGDPQDISLVSVSDKDGIQDIITCHRGTDLSHTEPEFGYAIGMRWLGLLWEISFTKKRTDVYAEDVHGMHVHHLDHVSHRVWGEKSQQGENLKT